MAGVPPTLGTLDVLPSWIDPSRLNVEQSLSHTIAQHKKSLRETARARLATVSTEDRAVASLSACERLIDSAMYRDARSMMLFISTPLEIDLTRLLDAALADRKVVCLPRMDWAAREMMPIAIITRQFPREVRKYGIVEPKGENPVALVDLELVVVPGLAFDLQGGRLGRGGGFYDRFLAGFRESSRASAVACGLCFEAQVIPEVPSEPHDLLLDAVVTESRVTLCRSKANLTDRT